MENTKKKFGRRSVALFWFAIVAVVIGFLIYFEQIALLYVIATLALVALLVTVGFSDLERINRAGFEDYSQNTEDLQT